MKKIIGFGFFAAISAGVVFFPQIAVNREGKRADAYRAQIDEICRTFQEVAKEASLSDKIALACSGSGPKKVIIDRLIESEPGTYSSTGYVIYEGGARSVSPLRIASSQED